MENPETSSDKDMLHLSTDIDVKRIHGHLMVCSWPKLYIESNILEEKKIKKAAVINQNLACLAVDIRNVKKALLDSCVNVVSIYSYVIYSLFF